MQELWQLGLDGNTLLPDKFYGIWNQFVKVLPSLDKITVSHHIDIWSLTAIQLIGFADASKSGQFTVVYLRIISASQISVHFMTCKTKVAPLRASENPSSLSIPRLEHCAALLLAQTLDKIKTK